MSPQKPAPKDWPRISSGVFYEDPKKAIDWLCEAFGFKVRLLVEGDGGRGVDGAAHHGTSRLARSSSTSA